MVIFAASDDKSLIGTGVLFRFIIESGVFDSLTNIERDYLEWKPQTIVSGTELMLRDAKWTTTTATDYDIGKKVSLNCALITVPATTQVRANFVMQWEFVIFAIKIGEGRAQFEFTMEDRWVQELYDRYKPDTWQDPVLTLQLPTGWGSQLVSWQWANTGGVTQYFRRALFNTLFTTTSAKGNVTATFSITSKQAVPTPKYWGSTFAGRVSASFSFNIFGIRFLVPSSESSDNELEWEELHFDES